MQLIEIASYPKSGNTWFRKIVEEFVAGATGKIITPGDIHQQGKEVFSIEKCLTFPNYEGEWLFYKSHIPNHPGVNPTKIIHIQRHPLDIFLSAINFFYIQATNGMNKNIRLNKMFINNIPKSVDNIFKDGELDYYFQDFKNYAGLTYWPGMLKEKSNYFEYQKQITLLDNCYTVKYEDLINDFDATVYKALKFALGDVVDTYTINSESVNKKTKGTGNPFYWKAKAGNFLDFLTEEQINDFYSKFQHEMKSLGY